MAREAPCIRGAIMNNFVRNNDFLICIDSDGCAMDSMEIKHKTCFGPQMIKTYGFEALSDEVQVIWNDINLYTLKRGINRFLGLLEALKIIKEKALCEVEEFDVFEKWATTAKELSNNSLMEEIKKTNNPQLKKALEWSENVNKKISAIPKMPGAFKGVYDAIISFNKTADICVVSSANRGAIIEEWTSEGLIGYVSIVMDQGYGSKASCIEKLVEAGGYDKNKVLMVGDALGDLKAAKSNGVSFYPILVNKEEFSWQRLKDEGVAKLTSGCFDGYYQKFLEDEFYNNLSK